MKSASPALIALLASSEFLYADLYTVTLDSGTVLYYTDADGDLSYNGQTYKGSAPAIASGSVKTSIGISVDTLDVTLYVGPNDLILGIPFPQFAQNGGFDGALIKVERCFMASYGDTSAGALARFVGRVSDVRPSRTEIGLVVSSMTELLNISMPRNLVSPGCLHTLFDAGCGLVKSAWGVSATLGSGSSAVRLNCGLTQYAGYFDLGTVTFTSGNNAGATRTIKSASPGVVNLSQPLPFSPAYGDTFIAYPGCDKRRCTCGYDTPIPLTVVDIGADALTIKSTAGLDIGTAVQFTSTGTLPAPLAGGTTYYVKTGTPTSGGFDFQVSATYGGAVINLTSVGTGTHSVNVRGKFNNASHFRGFPFVPSPTASL